MGNARWKTGRSGFCGKLQAWGMESSGIVIHGQTLKVHARLQKQGLLQ